MSSTDGLTVSSATLMHAVVAYHAPELLTLDKIISYHSRRALRVSAAAPNLKSLPVEVLLQIRGHLMPLLVAALKASTAAALVDYEQVLCNSLCAECLLYNRSVYGDCPWEWQNFKGGCDCHNVGVGLLRAGSRASAPEAKVPVQVYDDRKSWLESHLSGHAPLNKGIWDAVTDTLADFACEADRSSGASCKSVIVKPADSLSQGIEREVALWRATTELDLYAEDPASDDASFTATATVFASHQGENGEMPIKRSSALPPRGGFPSVSQRLVQVVQGCTALAGSALGLPVAFVRAARDREPTLVCAFAAAVTLRVALGAVLA